MTKKNAKLRERFVKIAEETLDEVLPKEDERPQVLSKAMRYAVLSGGKRIRPLVCMGSAIAAGGRPEDARYAAAAIELLHSYTLVHDDLPAMDNDAVRRGKPSVWKKFGEANAILAGDALQALAFKTASKCPSKAREVVFSIGHFGFGVVEGQVEDLYGKDKDPDFIYLHKTADLFIASAMAGAQAVRAKRKVRNLLGLFALYLGLAFQFKDDLLDGDGLFGREETKSLAKEYTGAALMSLAKIDGDTSFLRELALELLDRRK